MKQGLETYLRLELVLQKKLGQVRQIIKLKKENEKTATEIAKEVGVSRDTVYNTYKRLRL